MIKKTVAKEGVMGLYNGMEATFWRHVSWSEWPLPRVVVVLLWETGC